VSPDTPHMPDAPRPSNPATPARNALCVGGVRLDNVDGSTAIESIRRLVTGPRGNTARSVFFANVHTIHLARKVSGFRDCMNEADLILPDGSGLRIAGQLCGTPIRENLNGTDFIPKVLEESARQGWSVFLLGSRPEVVNVCRALLVQRYRGLNIVGHCHGHFQQSEEGQIVHSVNCAAPQIVLVAMGSPQQELWIHAHAAQLTARVCFAVGGLFDFLSGQKERAPQWMRSLGIEWLHRLWLDPAGKWQRVFVEMPVFLVRMIPEALRARRARSRLAMISPADGGCARA
jgi:N-acetylglucosaminyldiphosphoundecaprenol N-acetyl-beta-D-mannosaminyltransferase